MSMISLRRSKQSCDYRTGVLLANLDVESNVDGVNENNCRGATVEGAHDHTAGAGVGRKGVVAELAGSWYPPEDRRREVARDRGTRPARDCLGGSGHQWSDAFDHRQRIE